LRVPGTLAVIFGLLLFGAAGVLMYLHKPAPETEQTPDES
jgi:hypothetical protein